MDDIIQDFLTETSENLEQLDVDLVALEKDHNNHELLSNIFRTIHTIKGTCGFIGLPRLEKVAHHGENVLGRFRDGDLPVTPDAITAILHCIDTIKDIMSTLEETGQEPEGNDDDLIAQLDYFMNLDVNDPGAPPPSQNANHDAGPEQNHEPSRDDTPVDGDMCVDGDDSQESNVPQDVVASDDVPGTDVNVVEDHVETGGEAEDIFVPIPMEGAVFANDSPQTDSYASADDPAPAVNEQPESQPEHNKPQNQDAAKPAAVQKAPPPKEAPQKEAPKKSGASLANQSIRVNVGLLENLITSVSELVLARNQLLQIARDSENDEFKVPLQRLNYITSELQEGLMQTRMQPVGTAWSQLPRIIRDLSQDLGKEIDLEMIGAETELDRQVIEIIKDPLMHMVRNSADHGLEGPEERVLSGKSRRGHVILKAYHAGGHVVIEISDDGRGLNKERIIEKIIGNGLATPEQVEAMGDAQIYNHIFAAGFSTAAKITNVSGRGVGMDVVRSNIEKIGGSVEVNSKAGHGSVFTVKIPLTLAIVSALIIRSGGQRFAIPQVSIVELVQASADSDHTVEYVKGYPVLRLRNKLLPLITLSKVLEIQECDKGSSDYQIPLEDRLPEDIERDESAANAPQTLDKQKQPRKISDALCTNQYIIVAQVGSGQFGIIVDEVYDTEEIVVKPVSKILRSGNLFAGNTILGDGSVVMILDPKSVADKSGDMQGRGHEDDKSVKKIDSPNDRRMRFLIFHTGDKSPKAVPLDLIVRLEEIDTDNIELSNGVQVLQYRDRLMPLTSVSGYLDFEPGSQKAVLVFQQGYEYVGIVVDEIVDIVEENLDIKMNASMGGSFGSMVVNGRTTDLLDVDFFIQQVCPSWTSMLNDGPTLVNKFKPKVTSTIGFIDGCKLYRNLLSPLLELKEIKSMAFDTGDDAILYFTENKLPLDAIVFDKDSVGDNPEDFLKVMKDLYPNIPFFVVGAAFGAKDEVLFQQYECIACLAKNDRDSIIHTLKDYLEHSRSLAA